MILNSIEDMKICLFQLKICKDIKEKNYNFVSDYEKRVINYLEKEIEGGRE